MKTARIAALAAVLAFAIGVFGQGLAPGAPNASTPQSSQPAPSIASVVDREVSMYEKLMAEAAEAMPEGRFNFTPTSLNIPGSDFKGVRTFAEIVKHTAATNYRMWATLSGDKVPENVKGTNGSDELKGKGEIVQFLKDSFAVGHRAAHSLTATNAVEQVPFGRGEASRLFVATFAVIHCGDEYGQMVEYLRMNGVVPPASRGH